MQRAHLPMALLVFSGLVYAQSSALLYDDVKIFYQRAGETKFRDDKGVLALDGSQKVMLVLKENRPLFILRYDNINNISFEEKRDRTLTIRFGDEANPSGSVRMELPGKWREILETFRAQSGKPINMIAKQ